MSLKAKPYSSFNAVLIVSLIYFIRKQQGSSAYLIEIGGSSYTGMFGYLTGFQEMIQQVQVILFVWNGLCNMHFVCQKEIQVNNFFNLGRFISFVSLPYM